MYTLSYCIAVLIDLSCVTKIVFFYKSSVTTINLSQTNSIANNYLAALRDVSIQKDRLKFRFNLKRMGQIMAYEISKELEYSTSVIQTPLETANVKLLNSQPVVIAILRAALPFYDGVISVFDEADSGFIGAYRASDFKDSKSIKTEYVATRNLKDKTVILVDPMLASGKSMFDAITKLEAYGKPKQWIILSVIAAPEGIKYLEERLKENVKFWCGAIDKELNEKFYIIPGLGDAGDLAFGEKI